MAERTITLNSFSKNYLMTGWRVGVIIAEPELLAVMNRINGALVYTAPSISQRAAIQALSMRRSIREKYISEYRDRIFYAADRIEKIPYLSLVRPKGTFYLFPGIEKTGLGEKQFCKALLERAHILVTPGTGWRSCRFDGFPGTLYYAGRSCRQDSFSLFLHIYTIRGYIFSAFL